MKFIHRALLITTIIILCSYAYFSTRTSSPLGTFQPSDQLAQVVATTGLIAQYSFDNESSSGILSGGASLVSGKIGQALNLDGVDDMSVASNDFLTSVPQTISLWVNVRSYGKDDRGVIFSNGKTTFRVNKSTSNVQFSNNLYVNSSQPAVGALALNQWQHWVIVRDAAGAVTFYVNGTASGTAGQNAGSVQAGTGNVRFGNEWSAPRYFDGMIDGLYVYSGILTAAEIQDLYNLGSGGLGGGGNFISGSCGPAAKQYTVTELFPGGAYCSQGTVSPVTPTNPQAGLSSSWSCQGSNGGTSPSCSASRIQASETPVDIQIPTVPSGLSVTAASATQVNLSWSASTDDVGITGYRVYQNGSQVAVTTQTSYSISNLTESTLYSFAVAAYDASGKVSAQTSAASVTTSQGEVTSTTDKVERRTGIDGAGTLIETYTGTTALQSCADKVVAGQTCLAYPGSYARTDTDKAKTGTKNGTAGNPIVFKGLSGAISNGFYVRGSSYVKIEGFTFTGDVTSLGGYMVAVEDTTISIPSNVEITKNTFTGRFNSYLGGMISVEGSNHRINNNVVTSWIPKTAEPVTVLVQGTNTVVEQNTVKNSEDIDLFRGFGNGHIFRNNTILDIVDGPLGTHMDFFQTFGNLGDDAYNITLENNFVSNWQNGALGQISQVCGPTSSGGTGADVVECNNRPEMTGTLTSVSGSIVSDSSKTWITGLWLNNHWAGKVFTMISGTARGKVYVITSSTNSSLTVRNIDGSTANLSEDGVVSGDGYEIRMRVGWITYRNNVFHNIPNGLSGSIPYLTIVNNTFFNTAQAFTGGSPYRGRSVNGTFLNNVFVSDALPYVAQQAQIYPVGDDTVKRTFTVGHNFATKVAPGYAAHDQRCTDNPYPEFTQFRFCEENTGKGGKNGGDPLFSNINNPLGPDNTPFTSDDGLRPTAGSFLCTLGQGGTHSGAYSCGGIVVQQPPRQDTISCSAANIRCVDDAAGATQEYATIQACANAAQPGDTCLVYPGKYPEYVQITRGGTSGNRVIFKALNSAIRSGTTITGRSTVEGFRVQQPFVTVEGFDISGYSVGMSPGSLTIEVAGNFCSIKDNLVRDAVYLHSRQFYFNGTNNTITNPAGGFLAAQFKPGMQFYVTTNINREIKNGNKVRTIKSVTDTVITIADNETIVTEGPVIAVLYATRTTKEGINGISFTVNSSIGAASDCVVTGNTFRNLAGASIVARGSRHLFERNIIENANGFELINFTGNNTTFRYNHLRNSPRWPDMEAPIACVAGQSPGNGCAPSQLAGGHWDLVDNIFDISGHPSINGGNNVFEFNFVENVDNEFMRAIERYAGAGTARPNRGLIVRNNVFAGIEFHGAFHLPETKIVNNTFYRSGFRSPSQAFAMSSSLDGSADGSVIKNNVFVENNIPKETSGWYVVVSDSTYGMPMMDAPNYNFVAGPSSQSYPARSGFAGTEVNGINGCTVGLFGSCDRIFQNISNFVGSDGIPFTSDDGLRPLAGSPLCNRGESGTYIGAYSCPGTTFLVTGTTADFNHDGLVNSLDFSLMITAWNQSNTTYDLNKDGTVNTLDYSILIQHWTG